MTTEEVADVVQRAAEGGYFDDVLATYFDEDGGSRAEAEAYHEIYARVWRLVGGFENIPTVVIGHSNARFYGFVLSQQHWIDHLLHSEWTEIVPDELLVPVDCQLPLDVRARMSEDGRLALGGGNDESTRR